MAETATVPAKTESAQPRRPAPLDMFENMHEAMARLWSRGWPFDLAPITRHLGEMTPGAAMWTPRVDVFDKDGNLVVKAELAREADAAFLHGCGARHGEGEAAFGAHGEPAEFIVGEDAIGVALQIGEWRKDEAVLQGRAGLER